MLCIPLQIRFRDIDALGHVNNAVFLSYAEMARLEYFRINLGVKDASDFPFILARAEVDFKKPLLLTDRAEVRLSVSRLGSSSWDFQYEVAGTDSEAIYAVIKTVQVAYDYSASKSVPIPEGLREILNGDLVAQ